MLTVSLVENEPPVADAGSDQEVQFPVNLLILNGSQSSDDIGIIGWKWTKDMESPAAGVDNKFYKLISSVLRVPPTDLYKFIVILH